MRRWALGAAVICWPGDAFEPSYDVVDKARRKHAVLMDAPAEKKKGGGKTKGEKPVCRGGGPRGFFFFFFFIRIANWLRTQGDQRARGICEDVDNGFRSIEAI